MTSKPGRPRVSGSRVRVGDVTFQPLDVTDADAVGRVRAYVEQVLGRLDVLVNNAGISIEREKAATDVDIPTVRATLETNLFGPWMLSPCPRSDHEAIGRRADHHGVQWPGLISQADG